MRRRRRGGIKVRGRNETIANSKPLKTSYSRKKETNKKKKRKKKKRNTHQ